MRIIENKILPPASYLAINIFGVLFVRKGNKCLLDKFDINHEQIHTRQMQEMLYFFFYIWYGTEWLIRYLKCMDSHKAYRNISFEKESYANQHDLDYIKNRKFYSFLNYI